MPESEVPDKFVPYSAVNVLPDFRTIPGLDFQASSGRPDFEFYILLHYLNRIVSPRRAKEQQEKCVDMIAQMFQIFKDTKGGSG
jgi:hypothetical protein